MSRRVLRAVAALLVLCHGSALAAPHGASIGAGDATVSRSGDLTEVRQSTDRAIINWQGFSTNAAETVRFHQPSAAAVTLNRVVSVDPSILNGALEANGKLFLINPNGIVFGPGSQVNVGSLVASTLNVSDADFMAGRYRMVADPGKPLAAIINQGTIRSGRGGTVALLAPVVSNQGQIVAIAGRVVLAAGSSANLELDSGLVTLEPGSAKRDVVVGTDGAFNPLEQAVNNNMLVEAGSVRRENGRIILGGAEGVALNSGQVHAEGGQVIVNSTQTTVMAPGSVVSASDTAPGGQGGTVRALSQGIIATQVDSRMEARGGEGGRGGLVEASGSRLSLRGRVDTSAPNGEFGTYLIDPATLAIQNGADQGNLSGGTLDSGAADTVVTVGTIHQAAQNNNIVLEATTAISLEYTTPIDVGARSFTLRVKPPNTATPASITSMAGVGSITAASITLEAGTAANNASDATIAINSLSLNATGAGTVTISAFSVNDATLTLGTVNAGSTTINGRASNDTYTVTSLNATRGNVLINPSSTPITSVDNLTVDNMLTVNPNAAISLGQVTASNVFLSTSGGNITDANAGTVNVIAGTARAEVAGPFSVGAAGANNEIDFTTGNLLDLRGGTIFAGNSTNAESLSVITAPGQDVVVTQQHSTLSRTGGFMNPLTLQRTGVTGVNVTYSEIPGGATDHLHVGVFNAGDGTVSLASQGAGIRQMVGGGELVTASAITLNAASSIGQFGEAIDTAIATFTSLTAGAGTFINQTGVASIGASTSGGANFRFNSDSNVTLTGIVQGANVADIATTGSLFTTGGGRLSAVQANLVTNGTIGTSAEAPFTSTVGQFTALTGPGGIFVNNTGGTQIDSAVSSLGNISVTASGNIAAAGAITATNGNVALAQTTGGSITGVGVVSGQNVSLRAGTIGGGAALTVAPTGSLTIQGDAPGAINVNATGLPTSLTLNLAQTGSAVTVTQGVITLLQAAAGGPFSGTSATPLSLTLATGNLPVAGINAVNTALTLQASTGAILATPGTTLSAATMTLTAPTGIRDTNGNAAQIDATTLVFTSTGGSVLLTDVNGLAVNASEAGGAVALTALTGNLTYNGDVTAGGAVSLTASAGSIVDGTTGGGRVRGTNATLNAAGSVGSSGAPAETQVLTLSSTAGGSVHVREATALTVNALNAGLDVDVRTTGGDLLVTALSAGLDAILMASGSVNATTVSAGRDATVQASSGAATAGSVSGGRDVAIRATAGAVNASTVSAVRDATIQGSGDVSATTVNAGRTAFVESTGGDLTAGAIAGNVLVFLSAPAGRLVDGNGTAVNVLVPASLALLRAGSGIGRADDRIEMHAGELDALTTAGSIHLTETDTLLVRSATARGGSVSLDVVTGHLTIGALEARDDVGLTTQFGTLFDGNGGAVNITASTATLDIICEVGTPADPIEVALSGNLNATAFGVHVESAGQLRLGTVRPTFTSTIRSTGNMVIGRVDVNQGIVRLESTGGSIFRAPGSGMNLTVIGAATVEMVAAGTIGASDPLNIDVNPGILSVRAGDAINDVSASFNGTLEPFQFVTTDAAPGMVLLNGAVSEPPEPVLEMLPAMADASQTIVTVSAGNSGTTAVTAGVSNPGAGVPNLSDLISIDFAP